jgi:hypothetical protein
MWWIELTLKRWLTRLRQNPPNLHETIPDPVLRVEHSLEELSSRFLMISVAATLHPIRCELKGIRCIGEGHDPLEGLANSSLTLLR